MDKKILSLSLLLIIVIAVTVAYVTTNQLVDDQQSYIPENGDVTEEEIFNEIDGFFVSEDDEVEIGEMI